MIRARWSVAAIAILTLVGCGGGKKNCGGGFISSAKGCYANQRIMV